MNFFSTHINGMTPKQKGGLVAIVGGLGLAVCGLAVMSGGEFQVKLNGLGITTKVTDGGGVTSSSPQDNKKPET